MSLFHPKSSEHSFVFLILMWSISFGSEINYLYCCSVFLFFCGIYVYCTCNYNDFISISLFPFDDLFLTHSLSLLFWRAKLMFFTSIVYHTSDAYTYETLYYCCTFCDKDNQSIRFYHIFLNIESFTIHVICK